MRNDRDHARGWFLKAQSDLANGHRSLSGDGPYDTTCFHAQQAAEKCLKGLLACLGQPIPKTHNLEDLRGLCAALAPDLPLSDAELAELTPYAVQLRYDLDFWPDREEARKALETAERVRSAVLAQIPKEAQP